MWLHDQTQRLKIDILLCHICWKYAENSISLRNYTTIMWGYNLR